MKICHITSVHPATDNRIFHKECCSLAKAGHEVFYIVPGVKNEKKEGVNIVGNFTKYSNRFLRMTATVNKAYQKAIVIDADVYHFHDPELIIAGWLLKRRGKKVIYDVHEDVPRQILAKYWIIKPLRKLIAFLYEKIESNLSKKFDAIVTATPPIENRFKKYNKRSITINNFPSVDSIHPAEWSKKGREICYIGALTTIRGIAELIDAIENIDVKLHLAGTYSPFGFRLELMKKKGWKKVIEWGYADRKTISVILDRSKIGMVTLYPVINYLDSQPTKMYEYMAAAIPVIASDFPYWKKIIDTANCGTCVNPYSPQQIAKEITFYLNHDEKAQEYGKNGRLAIDEFYNWSNEEKKLIDLYIVLSNNNIAK